MNMPSGLTAIDEPECLPFLAAVEAAVSNRARSLGLSLRVSWDFGELVALLRATSGVVSPTYDPGCRRIDPASFWLLLRDGDTPVATTAFAYFAAGDLERHARARTLWFDRPPEADIGTFHSLPLCLQAPFTLGGAAWVHPSRRGQGLAYLLNVAGRLHILRHLPIRYFAGFVMQPLVAHDVPKTAYDYPADNVRLFLEGRPPPFTETMRMHAMFLSREEAQERLVTTALKRLTRPAGF